MKLFGFEIDFKRSSDSGSLPSILDTGKTAPTAFLGKVSKPQIGRTRMAQLASAAKMSGTPDKKQRLAPYASEPPRNAGGRVSRETNDTWDTQNFFNFWTRSKRNVRNSLRSSFDLDELNSMDYDALVELIGEISPEVSKALWDFVLLCNAGYECKAYKPDSDDIDDQAQAALDEILGTLAGYHGTLGVFFDRLFKMIFFRGSFLMELILADNGSDFVDIATPDTKTLSYKRVNDPDRGQTWTFGQMQDGSFVDLNQPLIKYVPIHPAPDSIEGQSLCSSAMFVSIFLMAVLRDTKRVVQHQGYLRLDVEIDFEALKETMPEDVSGNPVKVKEWMDALVDQVEAVYSKLQPDDTYIHGSTVKVNKPVGAATSDALAAIDSLFQVCERMAVRALKTIPLLLGTNQSRSETQANREWEIYAKGIESIQHPIETAFEQMCETALQAQGILADVRMRFHQFRAAEALRDEMVEMAKAKKARYLYDCGWISQDEAAQIGADKESADVPEPRNMFQPTDGFGAGTGDPEPGASRKKLPAELRALIDSIFDDAVTRQPTLTEADDAEDFWTKYAPENAKALIDADVEVEEEQ